MRRRVFIWWIIGLGCLWLFANWPYSHGLANFFQQAGFPLVFWARMGSRSPMFDGWALTVDVVLGVVVVFGIAAACALSRKSEPVPSVRSGKDERS